ncbi:MAG: hydrogenase formation protein HypD [Abditibacteriota bacterium]|nr:hydrogenase formation protein HypD [Abditibacteriota bacterium]
MIDLALLRDGISGYRGRPVRLMEVCGSHTAAVMRYGIRSILPDSVRLISGPGCPVCAADEAYLRSAAGLAGEARLMSFGDMARSVRLCCPDAPVETVLSPLAAVEEAACHPDERIVFLSVGFETTNPVCALSVLKAKALGLTNFSLLVCNKRMPPILEHLAAGDAGIDGYLLPGHVCAVSGTGFYEEFCRKYRVKGCVAGFDPEQILGALYVLLLGSESFYNGYSYVKREGSPRAMAAVEEVFEPCAAVVRGLGPIPGAGLRLRDKYADYDAARIYRMAGGGSAETAGCRCGDVICGRITPEECPLFGIRCRPEEPKGPCMISSEGTCAAYYDYGERRPV